MNSKKKKRKKLNSIFFQAFMASIIIFMLLLTGLGLYIIFVYDLEHVPSDEEDTVVSVASLSRNDEEEPEFTQDTGIPENTKEENPETEEKPDEENPGHLTPMIGMNTFIDATSISLEWEDTNTDGYIVKYFVKNEAKGQHGKANKEDKSMSMDEICTCIDNNDSNAEEKRENGWHIIETSDNKVTISGLKPGSETDIHIYLKDEAKSEYKELTSYNTLASGYGDPFADEDSFFCFSERDMTSGKVINKGEITEVKMSSPEGCLGAKVKLTLETEIYSDVSSIELLGKVKKGADGKITADSNGNYCYYTQNGNWLVHFEDTEGNKGWLNARTLMIDAMSLFKPENGLYGTRINRTNAKSSIFTAGGSAKAVDNTSDSESRYNVLNSDSLDKQAGGLNSIDNVTGEVLPNYGSSEEFPVIWDLALEINECQKNALENGYVLILYDGYRPQSASKRVSDSLSGSGYLSVNVNNKNLAKGFLSSGSLDYTYYISKYSRHNKGTAVDLSLVRFSAPYTLSEEAEMQTKMHTLDFRCNMHYNTWEADLLSDIMMGHGSNLECLGVRSEWWHFQLKNNRKDLYPLIDSYGYNDFVF